MRLKHEASPGRAEMLALSLPSFVFSGYELARKTYLPMLLVDGAGLGMGRGGLVLTITAGWIILVELLFGMVCDLSPDPRRRRGFWIVAGTLLQWVGGLILLLGPSQGHSVALWMTGLLPLASGWVLSNLAHGAWALERASGIVARGRIFGARAQAGMAGSILFGFVLLSSRHGAKIGNDFYALLVLTMVGAPLVHGLLIWRVPERGGSCAREPMNWAVMLKPFRVCVASPADASLAGLFLMVGAHMAVIGSSFLFIARYRLALPDWGTPGIVMQAVAAMAATGVAPRLLHKFSPLRMLTAVFAANLALGLALPLLPQGRVWPFMAWAFGSGATMAVDFMLLRVLLGQRLDRDRERDGDAPAAAFYAGFHLPFNIGAMIGTGLLFHLAALSVSGAMVWLTCALSTILMVAALACAFVLGHFSRREGGHAGLGFKLNNRIFDTVIGII